MKSKTLVWQMLVLSAWAGVTIRPLRAQQTSLPPEVVAYADLVLYNGKFLTADEKFTVVEAVAVRDGRFLAVGKADRILPMAGPQTRKIDLKGKTVTPGIIDLHNSPFNAAVMDFWGKKWLPKEPRWATPQQALEGIKRAVARAKPGEGVVIPRDGLSVPVDAGVGGRAGLLCEVLTLEQIDSVSPETPVFFIGVVNATTNAMNSKAASVVARFLPKEVSSPFTKPGKACVSRGADVDGVLTPGSQAGNDYVYWAETMDERLPTYKETQRKLNAMGTTLIKEHMGVPLFNGVHALWERGELTVRFRMPFPMIPQISGHTVEVPADQAEMLFRRWMNMSKIGDPMLRIVGIRIPAVGGNVPGGDAWMLDPKIRPYPDRWGNPSPYGGRIQEQDAVEKGLRDTFRGREVLVQATRFGWDVSADHTVGDRAFREVLKAFEEGLQGPLYYQRPNQRLTTNHTPMAHKDDILKASQLGVWSSISTGHVIGGYGARDLEAGLLMFGIERVNNMVPMKSYVNAGLHPSLESTMWEFGPPDEPGFKSSFFWIGKSITRKDEKYKRVWNPSEAFNRQEALWASTLWSAQQLAEEKDLGSIETGKLADLVVLDKDYLTVPTEEIEGIKPLLTMVGGKVAYEVEGGLQ